MGRETAEYSRWRWSEFFGLVWLVGLAALPSCQGIHSQGGLALPFDSKSGTQQGMVTLREGQEIQVCYLTPFQSPPRLILEEVKASRADDKPYRKSDFQIVQQEAASFKIRNNHAEHWGNSWATVQWRAEGILAGDQTATVVAGSGAPAEPGKEANLRFLAKIKKAGGTAQVDMSVRERPIIGIDLHGTKTTDADLEQLTGLTGLRTLNLHDTRVTDAGLKSISGLISLETLYLNGLPITDAGLEHLQGLTNLQELGLSHTRITDHGLVHLQGLTHLHNLSLNETPISDGGLVSLTGLRELKQLHVGGKGVSAAGVQELKKAMPKTLIFQ